MHQILSSKIFKNRRENLLQKLPEKSVVLLFAGDAVRRNNDVFYPFRQESYFWYFTGFPEDKALLLLTKNQSIIFNKPRDPLTEIWEGEIIGQERAISDYGFDKSYSIDQIDQVLEYLSDADQIYSLIGVNCENDQKILNWLTELNKRSGRNGAKFQAINNLRIIADEMRLIKSTDEINLIRKAVEISTNGHKAAMIASKAAKYEYQIQAAIEHSYREQNGCDWSFPSIIAGGKNACCLHYRLNNQLLKSDDLILVDSGAEFAGYAGDITRTFPKNGKFNKNQQALYEVVLHGQLTAIRNTKPGISHQQLHQITQKALIDGLLSIKLIKGCVDDWIADNKIKQFFPHGTGHWLGLDVHDVGKYYQNQQSRTYQNNMLITIEPGIYIQPDDTTVDEKWRGIGIRIEDDILITEQGCEVLSSNLPKTVAEIEQFMK